MGTKGGKKLAQSQHQRREMHNILLSSITTHVRLNTGKKLYSLKVLTCAYTINVNNKKEKKSLIFLCYLSYRLHISNSHWKKLHHTAVLLGLLQVMTLYRLLLSCYYCFSCVIFFLEIECLFVYLKNNQIFFVLKYVYSTSFHPKNSFSFDRRQSPFVFSLVVHEVFHFQ